MSVPPNLLDPLTEQSAIISGLDKFTEYNVTVLCFTEPGDGPQSDYVLVRTKEDSKFSIKVSYLLHVQLDSSVICMRTSIRGPSVSLFHVESIVTVTTFGVVIDEHRTLHQSQRLTLLT